MQLRHGNHFIKRRTINFLRKRIPSAMSEIHRTLKKHCSVDRRPRGFDEGRVVRISITDIAELCLFGQPVIFILLRSLRLGQN